MSEYAFLLTIGTIFTLGTMSPGPSFILIAKTAVSKSRKEGFAVAIGLGLRAVIFSLLAIFGLYAILKTVLFGFATQISNPKTAIIIGSIFAALLPKELPPFGALLVCLLAFFIDVAWYAFVVGLLSTQKAQKVYLHSKKHIDRLAGSVLGILGLKLALDRG